MTVIPVSIYDNFFTNPDAIRKYALSLNYSNTDGKWPGLRTNLLHTIDQELFSHVNSRILKVFFPEEENVAYNARTCFQKITEIHTKGWVHPDPAIITAIIYLTPNADPRTGTSIYRLKKEHIYYRGKNMDIKEQFYTVGDNAEEERIAREKNNAMFEETINVSNVYNRLVVFDSAQFHAAKELSSTENNPERLTLISFFVRTPVDLPHLRLRRG